MRDLRLLGRLIEKSSLGACDLGVKVRYPCIAIEDPSTGIEVPSMAIGNFGMGIRDPSPSMNLMLVVGDLGSVAK